MFEIAVTNASPLIYLGRTGHLDLLRNCARTVCVPEAVVRETRDDMASRAIDSSAWLRVVQMNAVPSQIAVWDLGDGESAVLAWVLSYPGVRAVIDDLEGRRCAGQLGIRVIGTLGVVLAAKRRGLIPAAGPVVKALIDAGLYLAEEIVSRALALAGE